MTIMSRIPAMDFMPRCSRSGRSWVTIAAIIGRCAVDYPLLALELQRIIPSVDGERLWEKRLVGVIPSIRRNVLVKCAASENPALHAADVTVEPACSSEQARCRRRPRTYRRNGIPSDSVKTCMNRDRERPEIAAKVLSET